MRALRRSINTRVARSARAISTFTCSPARLIISRRALALAEEAQPGPGHARNRGVALSRAPLVAFTDSDCRVAPDWLTVILQRFAEPSLEILGGEIHMITEVPGDPNPAEAFDYYRDAGVARVVCEEKHMGSRAVVIVCRDEASARKRFGVVNEGVGICYTRTGRRFFDDQNLEREFLDRLQAAAEAAGFWGEFDTDWLKTVRQGGAVVEGRLGPLVSVSGVPKDLAPELAKQPSVLAIRTPRLARRAPALKTVVPSDWSPLRRSGVAQLHTMHRRGKGMRVAVIADDFTGWEKLPGVKEKLVALSNQVDEFHVHGRELYWLCRKRMSESTITGGLIEKAAGGMQGTNRNVTTVRKLAAKYGGDAT